MNAVAPLPDHDRRQGLGASEAAAACGLSPWMSPLELFLQKTGRAPAVEETLPMRVGKALEPVVLRAFEDREGVKVTDQQRRIVDPRLPWRWATLDGMADGVPVEAKTSGSAEGWGDDGSDQVPLHYMLQAQHQLACLEEGVEILWMPVLFAARDLRVYRIPRSPSVIEALTEKEVAFWDRVVADQPPEIINSTDVRLRWPTDTGATVVATDDILDAWLELHAARSRRKAAEADEERLQTQLQLFMADRSALLGPDGKALATWKACTSSRLDTKALAAAHPDIAAAFRVESSSRRFLLK
jgi:putative phage-type endonuclease